MIDPLIAEHSGRIVKLMGDGALVEFGSAVDAVACAIEIQKHAREHDAGSAACEELGERAIPRSRRETVELAQELAVVPRGERHHARVTRQGEKPFLTAKLVGVVINAVLDVTSVTSSAAKSARSW